MKRAIAGLVVLIVFGITLVSCSGGYNSNTNPSRSSGLARRIFVSDPVFPTLSGGSIPALAIVDASDDLLSAATISLSSIGASIDGAGMMAVSPKRTRTLVFSSPDNKLGIVNNGSESLATAISLTAASESFLWTDDSTVFVAVPAAPVSGQTAGTVMRFDIPSGNTTATIPIPRAHYIASSPDGSKILVFSDNSDSVVLITPSLLGTASSSPIPPIPMCDSLQRAVCTIPTICNSCTVLPTFDRPIGAVFDPSSSTAYVLNCGPQCGGTGVGACPGFTSCTSVAVLDVTQSPPAVVNNVAVPAATTGLLQGNSLFVAGTPALAPDNDCSGVTPATAATTCGRLTVISTQSLSASSVAITDGYHTRMALSADGQLFVGSRNCTNIDITGGEVRGCLTIVNVSSGSLAPSAVIAPPDNGDVTGIEPITNRNVVYVCEGGKLRIYDTTTDKLEIFPTNVTPPVVVGQAVDVKMADF